jgi:hypothetical protein
MKRDGRKTLHISLHAPLPPLTLFPSIIKEGERKEDRRTEKRRSGEEKKTNRKDRQRN